MATIDTETLEKLEKLRSKWNLDSAVAQKNRVKYILRRAAADVTKVGGSEDVLLDWQAQSLAALGVGTHEEVAETAVAVAVEAVQSAFEDYPEGSLFHHVGVTVAEQVVAGVESELGVELNVEPAPVTGGIEVVPGYLDADERGEAEGLPRSSRAGWLRTFLSAGVGAAIFLTAGLAGVGSGGMGQYAYASSGVERSAGTQSFIASSAVAPSVTVASYSTSYNFGGGSVPTGVVGGEIGEAAFRLALSAVGTPYVFGGASRSGFDCSGLIMWAYAAQGVSLPHGVRSQSAVSVRVPESEARLGDIVVMPGHNGFWAGPGMILDAPRPGGSVSVRPIWTDGYWIERVIG